MGYALYTTHERPVFFNQPISTGKNFFRFEVKKPPQSALWARRREPLGQPLRNVTPLCLGYPIFFPNNPDASALARKHLRKYIDDGKENKEKPNNN